MMKLALILLYVLALCSELAKFLFELFINAVFREQRELQPLSATQVAVVIPCFNSEEIICETLAALPHQYAAYCVVNNSSDQSAQFIRQYQQRTGRDIRILDFPLKCIASGNDDARKKAVITRRIR